MGGISTGANVAAAMRLARSLGRVRRWSLSHPIPAPGTSYRPVLSDGRWGRGRRTLPCFMDKVKPPTRIVAMLCLYACLLTALPELRGPHPGG